MEGFDLSHTTISSGDTVFMMLCTAMVCLMTPGLAFFMED